MKSLTNIYQILISGLLAALLLGCYSMYNVQASSYLQDQSVNLEAQISIEDFQPPYITLKTVLLVSNATEELRICGNMLHLFFFNLTPSEEVNPARTRRAPPPSIPMLLLLPMKSESPLPGITTYTLYSSELWQINGFFPYDSYNQTVILGIKSNTPVNIIRPRTSKLSLPTNNYFGFYVLESFSNLSELPSPLQVLLSLPQPFVNMTNINNWVIIRLQIGRTFDFVQYADLILLALPFWFSLLFYLLMVIPILIIYDWWKYNKRLSSNAHLVENVLIPVCVGIIVFIPIYILNIRPLEAPFGVTYIDLELAKLAIYYSILLAGGYLLRLASRKPDNTVLPRERQYSQELIGSTYGSVTSIIAGLLLTPFLGFVGSLIGAFLGGLIGGYVAKKKQVIIGIYVISIVLIDAVFIHGPSAAFMGFTFTPTIETVFFIFFACLIGVPFIIGAWLGTRLAQAVNALRKKENRGDISIST